MTTYIPNNLRILRKNAGLRQQDLAQILGIDTIDRISRWEKGLCYPNVPTLFKLARFFNVKPHEIYVELFSNSSLDKITLHVKNTV